MCNYMEHDSLYTSEEVKILKLKLSAVHAIKVACEGIAPSFFKLDNRRSRVTSFKHRSIIHVENVRIHTEYGMDETQSQSLPLRELMAMSFCSQITVPNDIYLIETRSVTVTI